MQIETRNIDPSTAPNVPILTVVDWKQHRNPPYEIVIQGWDRKTDKKYVYTIKVETLNFVITDLDAHDKAWLQNIGAREWGS